MATRMIPGAQVGAQLVTQVNNAGQTKATNVANLNFNGQSPGSLVKTVASFQPPMRSGVTMDNTFTTIRQSLVAPITRNSQTITYQFRVPEFCKPEDITIAVPMIFRWGRLGMAKTNQNQQWTAGEMEALLEMGDYVMAPAGMIGAVFHNARIKIGAQVTIASAFEQTKTFYALHNSRIRGDDYLNFTYKKTGTPQGATVWRGCFNPQWVGGVADESVWRSVLFHNKAYKDQSFKSNPFVQWMVENQIFSSAAQDPDASIAGREKHELVHFNLAELMPLFNQPMLIFPGQEIVIEIDPPIINGYDPNVFDPTPNGNWAPLLSLVETYTNGTPIIYDHTAYAVAGTIDLGPESTINHVATNQMLPSVFYCSVLGDAASMYVHFTGVGVQAEIATQINSARIQAPLVFNSFSYTLTNITRFVAGTSEYQYVINPQQVLPQQLLIGFMNSSAKVCTRTAANIPLLGQGARRTWVDFSGTPFMLDWRRIIFQKGGYLDLITPMNYYTNGLNPNGIISTGAMNAPVNPMRTTPRSLFPSPLEQFQQRKFNYKNQQVVQSGNPMIEQYRYLSRPWDPTRDGWFALDPSPVISDLGFYDADQQNLIVTFTIEIDPTPANGMYPVMTDTNLVVVRVNPAQISIALDGSIKVYTWPYLLIENNMATSGNPAVAGQGEQRPVAQ